MRKDVFKKGIVLGIIILFVGAGVVPSISGDTKEPVNVSVTTEDTVYVDDDYNESTPGWNDTHFDNIQDAIDAIDDGDTVYVYSGIYYENIIINKSSINLAGEEPISTIIDGGGLGVVIHIAGDLLSGFSNDNEINGFTIQNGDYIGIWITYSDNTHIYENIVKNNQYGIRLWHTSGDSINYNNVIDNEWGIYTELTDHCSIYRNCLYNSSFGILCDSSDSMDINYNDIRGCKNYGIFLARDIDPDKNRIHHNNFIDNKEHASFKNCKNKWNDNYWGNSISAYIFGIYIIGGVYEIGSLGISIPSFQFDLRCAKTPYDIECAI